MSIFYNKSAQSFRLRAKDTDYIIKVAPCGYLAHVYFGKALPDEDLSYLLRLDENPFTPETNNRDRAVYLDTLPLEFSCFGIGDYREPALKIRTSEGNSTCDMRYKSHVIYSGKPVLSGLPATFSTEESKCDTLEITLYDDVTDVETVLVYTAFEKLNAFARSVRITNKGGKPVTIERIYSACFEFDTNRFDMITLYGSWARERHIERHRLHHGKQEIDSMRGESSHQYNPFNALCSHNADEDNGEVYGFNFVYSGNFRASAEVNQHDKTRFVMGINDMDFSWKLESGQTFTAPEVTAVYSREGIGGMSRTFHDLYRNNLIRGEYRSKRSPVLINNWEATYFNFDTQKLLSIARTASSLGIEMLVMDDGWFGHRDSDNSSLGDWFVYESKISGGLEYLVKSVNSLGMKFGLWIEPEMVSPDSELYRSHPDWTIHIKNRELTMCREQYVLDYSRKEVRDFIYGMIRNILDSANIEYIKWDMNRQLTEVGSSSLPSERQKELWHRYVLGVYELLERLTSDYPHILIESCSGGGARFDAGMLYYSPQIWCSDDTDAFERLKIQYGTSLCYPCCATGSHVSDCPNHTTGRITPFSSRADVALAGAFGYELDITAISENDRKQIPMQIQKYKKYSELVRKGDLYRMGDVFSDCKQVAFMFVAKDKSEALVEYFQILCRPNTRSVMLKLKGLEENAFYYDERNPDFVLSGSALMNCGINIKNLYSDFQSETIHLIRK